MTIPEIPDDWWADATELTLDGFTPRVVQNANAVMQHLALDPYHHVPVQYQPEVQLVANKVGDLVIKTDAAIPTYDASCFTSVTYADALTVFDYLRLHGTQPPMQERESLTDLVSERTLHAVESELIQRYVKRKKVERKAEIEGLISDNSGPISRLRMHGSVGEATDHNGDKSLYIPAPM